MEYDDVLFQEVRVGLPAPEFTLDAVMPNKQFGTVSLSENIKQGKYTVLFFYPLDFTFVCPTEIIAFSEAASQFEAENAQLIGASVDSVYAHLTWINTERTKGGIGQLNYPLASDLTKEVALTYGILSDDGTALRGLFIINPEGELVYEVVTHDNIGRSVEETLRVLKAVKTGGQCPANWVEGEKTL